VQRIPGTVSSFHARPAQVYLPPAWFSVPRPSLPVIELLHGTPGTPEDWTRAGAADVTADAWAAAHDGVAPIIVMADENGGFLGDSECVDGAAGRAETYLTEDVPSWAVANLGASADRRQWVIAGNSEGGFCALDLALRHPDRFATFLDFGGLGRPTRRGGSLRLFRGSRQRRLEHQPGYLLRHYQGPPLSGWFEVGGADGGTTVAVRHMFKATQAAGIDTHLVVLPGAHHTWRVWRQALIDAFPFAATRSTG
jgi:S-formylglutathione hydrolase FrmB